MSKLRMFKVEIPVDYDQAWADAIRQGAPSTDSGWPIWGVEDQFPTDQKGTVAEKLRFVQFGPSFYRQAVLDYAKSEGGGHSDPPALYFGHHGAPPQDRRRAGRGGNVPQLRPHLYGRRRRVRPARRVLP